MVKKLGNSSFEREDEEVTYILCFFRAGFQTLVKRLMMLFGFCVDFKLVTGFKRYIPRIPRADGLFKA